ncbi:MAG: FAD-dependent oxidoreductase [Phycisphaerae bacterium]|nr:FAD-dependent oxidoreductase [Phycisphaerae bacterium]
MQVCEYDILVVGAGAAGMAVALACRRRNLRAAVVEREEEPGGILLQCIHNGFGLQRFGEELTGPEYAERYLREVEGTEIDVFCGTTAVRLTGGDAFRSVVTYSAKYGVREFRVGAVILAVGCRERNRGNIGIPGTRPAGIFTAGLAQRLTNIDGYIPGSRVVIVGSGDIGLIMARRMTWLGAKVLGVVEIMPTCSGLLRNVVQCLEDFDIPLYLSHVVTRIEGAGRVRAVEVAPWRNGQADSRNAFRLECDTLLLSVGLIPEHELARDAGVGISPDTRGPFVDANLMTNIPGVFACGNGLHVHDVVDYVSEESERCGRAAADFVTGITDTVKQIPLHAGANVRYVLPGTIAAGRSNLLSLRSMVECEAARCTLHRGEVELATKTFRHVRPAEMIRWNISAEMTDDMSREETQPLDITIQCVADDE